VKKALADIGLIGLAVMGQNLVLNMDDHKYKVVVYNRTSSKTDEFLQGIAKGTSVCGAHSIQEFCAALKRPRKVFLMVKAGQAVDDIIEECLPFLEPGDILIDGGNSYYKDSSRRYTRLKSMGILFVGAGISGGEEGARHGPSIMPGGSKEAWPAIQSIFQSIAATSETGEPCCDWIGDGGSGHYVKMVHNGIEYGDIQIICEAYHCMKLLFGFSAEDLSQIFATWNKGRLNSYLIEITSKIFAYKDSDGTPLIDKILDVAGQKGTGKWTGINALEFGVPVTLIAEAVFARCLSSLKEERLILSTKYSSPAAPSLKNKDEFLNQLEQALYSAKIISYAQGFMLIRAAAIDNNWKLDLGGIALLWREGCIIRSRFLKEINEAYKKTPHLESLFFDTFFQNTLATSVQGLREIVALCALHGIPIPCLSTALSFFDGYRCPTLPSNLLQAQRDFFGAHTYERIDHPRGEFFHTDWAQTGGTAHSSTYTV